MPSSPPILLSFFSSPCSGADRVGSNSAHELVPARSTLIRSLASWMVVQIGQAPSSSLALLGAAEGFGLEPMEDVLLPSPASSTALGLVQIGWAHPLPAPPTALLLVWHVDWGHVSSPADLFQEAVLYPPSFSGPNHRLRGLLWLFSRRSPPTPFRGLKQISIGRADRGLEGFLPHSGEQISIGRAPSSPLLRLFWAPKWGDLCSKLGVSLQPHCPRPLPDHPFALLHSHASKSTIVFPC